MLQKIDRTARRFRDRLIARQNRRTGPAFVNAVLSASGRAEIGDADYRQWLDQLSSDPALSHTYEAAKPILHTDAVAKAKTPGDWPSRVGRIIHLADMFYILPRAMRPERVIETGVAFGTTSALLLAAMNHNGAGSLVSIDLPAHAAMNGHASGNAVGALVPAAYRDRWDLRQVDALVGLQPAFAEGVPDIFIHDSDHSYRHMMFEYALAASYMEKGSILISDDTRMNNAFYDFTGAVGAKIFPHGLNDSVAVAVL